MTQVNDTTITANSDVASLKEQILKIKAWGLFILSKWIIIVIAGVVGSGIGLAYAWSKKPIYIAQLSFALQDEKAGDGLSSAMGLASQFGIDLGGSAGGEFSGDNLLQLMKSRTIVEATLLTPVLVKNRKTTLAELYIDFNKIREGWKDDPQLSKIQFLPGADRSKFTLKQDSVLGVFYKTIITNNLVVDKLDKKLSINKVTVGSTNELFSKYFAEVLTKVVSDFYIKTRTEKASKNVALLQRQTDSVRRMLNSAISGVAVSQDVNPNPNPNLLQTLRVPSQRRQFDVQANTVMLNELVRNLEVSKMSLLKETPFIQIIDKPILPLDVERFRKLKGLVLGGVIAAFLTIVIIVISRASKIIMS